MTTMVYFLFSLVLHDLDTCHLLLSLLTRVFLAVSDADVNPFVPHPAPGHPVPQFFSTLAKAASLTPMRPCTPVKKTILVSCQTPKDPSTRTKTQCFKLTSMSLDWCEAQLHFNTHPLLIPSAAGQRQAVCSIPILAKNENGVVMGPLQCPMVIFSGDSRDSWLGWWDEDAWENCQISFSM